MSAEEVDLERDAATVLGYMLFEYSRLDMELGLFLVWADKGKNLEVRTKKFGEANFAKRLDELEKLVNTKYAEADGSNQCARWIRDAHAVRSLRNQLFHGRWGFVPHEGLVANVVGLPTSPNQTEVRYSIAQLHESLLTVKGLRQRLAELKQTWPI